MNVAKLVGVVGLLVGSFQVQASETPYDNCLTVNSESFCRLNYAARSVEDLERERLQAEIDLLRAQQAQMSRDAEERARQARLQAVMMMMTRPEAAPAYKSPDRSRTVCNYNSYLKEVQCDTRTY